MLLTALQQFDRVAQLGGAFVRLAGDSYFHLALHDLQLGEWALGTNFFQPLFKESQLRAFRSQLGEVGLLKKFLDGIATTFDLSHGVGKLTFAEQDGGFGAGVHHENVRAELLEAPDELVALGVIGDEGKEIKIALGVAHDPDEVINLKEAKVTVVILDAFLLQLVALLTTELVIFAAGFRALGPALMIGEERFAVMRTLSVGAAGHFHLENAEIDAELQFLLAIKAGDFAHFDAAAFVRPILLESV